ncbi:hypothetical protein D3C80_1108120 [compost metagenome]
MFLFKLSSEDNFKNISAYDLLAAITKDPLPFTIGASANKRAETVPIPPDVLKLFTFPSFIRTSRIEESRPPYIAGIPPLISFTSFTASGSKTEKKPNK